MATGYEGLTFEELKKIHKNFMRIANRSLQRMEEIRKDPKWSTKTSSVNAWMANLTTAGLCSLEMSAIETQQRFIIGDCEATLAQLRAVKKFLKDCRMPD